MFSRKVLYIDPARTAEDIARTIREQVLGTLRKRGAVVGMSGGVDSSVVAALCARALGSQHVFGVLMPERDSSDDALRLARRMADQLQIAHVVEPIGAALEAFGCYARQDKAIRMVVPEFGPGWRFRLGMPSLMECDRLNITLLTVRDPDGNERTVRMRANAYLQLVAATSFKQRARKTMEYYHADRLNYGVVGTANFLEHDQGFFVKQGDGAADLKPIAHLYKTQVYELAEHLEIPLEIRSRPPTADTFSLSQSQEAFYFRLPYAEMDLCLWAFEHGTPAAETASVLGFKPEQIRRVYRDIEAKRRVARYLHAGPLLAGTKGH